MNKVRVIQEENKFHFHRVPAAGIVHHLLHWAIDIRVARNLVDLLELSLKLDNLGRNLKIGSYYKIKLIQLG